MPSGFENRLALEAKLMQKYLPQFRLVYGSIWHYFSGLYSPTAGGEPIELKWDLPDFPSLKIPPLAGSEYFELKLKISNYYPFEMPRLYVVYPSKLWKYKRKGYVNSVEVSHEFHTSSNGPGGCVQICHFSSNNWNSSKTCVGVMTKAILWVEAYCTYLATGISIAKILNEWMGRQS
jgi:hypothetical protein